MHPARHVPINDISLLFVCRYSYFVLYLLHRLLALIFSQKAADTVLEFPGYSHTQNTRGEAF